MKISSTQRTSGGPFQWLKRNSTEVKSAHARSCKAAGRSFGLSFKQSTTVWRSSSVGNLVRALRNNSSAKARSSAILLSRSAKSPGRGASQFRNVPPLRNNRAWSSVAWNDWPSGWPGVPENARMIGLACSISLAKTDASVALAPCGAPLRVRVAGCLHKAERQLLGRERFHARMQMDYCRRPRTRSSAARSNADKFRSAPIHV